MAEKSINIPLVTLMALTNMASKACEHRQAFEVGLLARGQNIDALQVAHLVRAAIIALAKVDELIPGFVPLPHDGKSWTMRAEELAGS